MEPLKKLGQKKGVVPNRLLAINNECFTREFVSRIRNNAF